MISCVYFCFKKASKPLDKEERAKWMRKIIIIFLVGIPINIAMLLLIQLRVSEIDGELASALDQVNDETLESEERQYKKLASYGRDCITCLSPYWITNAFADFVQVICFYLLVKKIHFALERKIEEEMKDYGYPRDYF